jgi:cell division protein FtsI (penicillin-binding protein 3)
MTVGNSASPQFHRRLVFLSAVFIGLTLVVVGRLIYWQQLAESQLPPTAIEGLEGSATQLSPQRGPIFDRHGLLLAAAVPEYNLIADPFVINDPVSVARTLETLLGSPAGEIATNLQDRSRRWVPLRRGIPARVATEIDEAGLPGISLEPAPRRFYPMHASGAHLIGFVSYDHRAYYGLEERYDGILAGTPGWWGGQVVIDPREYRPVHDGASLVLTIDWTIQHMAELALESAVNEHRADGGTILIMEPRTGAVLALANWPSYDPNSYGDATLDRYVDPAISTLYEPGSVIKVVTLAAGLQEGVITPDTTYDDTGCIEVEKVQICNWGRQPHGRTTMAEMMQHSLNVGAVHVVQELGAERFYPYLEAFGFGQLTNVDLPHEVPGIIRTPGSPGWSELVLANNAFGQGIAATPLQVLTAIAAVANGVVVMQPYTVERIIYPDGRVTVTQPVEVRRAISAQTAATVNQVLVEVVNQGVTQAQVPGYSVAGKTGTSQIPTQRGYDPDWTIASFAGYGPAENPRFAILVKIDRPHQGLGSDVAAPVFKALAQQLFAYYGIAPDDVRLARAPMIRVASAGGLGWVAQTIPASR